jgi:hypothetical protein
MLNFEVTKCSIQNSNSILNFEVENGHFELCKVGDFKPKNSSLYQDPSSGLHEVYMNRDVFESPGTDWPLISLTGFLYLCFNVK